MNFLNNEIDDPHIISSLACSNTALEILECLPECDLLQELHNILLIQKDILFHVLNDKHFGSERIESFLSLLAQLQYETRKLKNVNKEN